jgi:drug/metabolite transporter (DMT)-like permease
MRAVLLLASGVTLFGIMDGLGKLLAGDYSVVQVVWARYAFALPVILGATSPGAWSGLLKCERPWMQAARAMLPLLASVTVILGLTQMPLADFTAISFVSPFLVVALSASLLGERISAHRWIAVACGFLGLLIVVRPGRGAMTWAAIFPLGTAFLFALYQVLTRIVSRQDNAITTLAWTVAIGLVLTTLTLPFHWRLITGSDWLLFGLSGLLFGFGQFLLIRAFSMADAGVLAPFTYVQIVAAIVFGAMVFGDLPDTWTLTGTSLIIVSGLYVLRRQAA